MDKIGNVEPKVTFTVIGVQKSGTKALSYHLGEHPEIGLTNRPGGEPHYFDDENIDWGNPDYSSYHDLFDVSSAHKTIGDVTPIYIYWKPALNRINQYNEAMKIILILRDPVERAYSQWNMEYERGTEKSSFPVALLSEILRLRHPNQCRVRSYLGRGFYYNQIKNLFSHFTREQCLILKQTDLLEFHQLSMIKIYKFLDVDEHIVPPQKIIHNRDYTPMHNYLKLLLYMLYYVDVKRTKKLLRREYRE